MIFLKHNEYCRLNEWYLLCHKQLWVMLMCWLVCSWLLYLTCKSTLSRLSNTRSLPSVPFLDYSVGEFTSKLLLFVTINNDLSWNIYVKQLFNKSTAKRGNIRPKVCIRQWEQNLGCWSPKDRNKNRNTFSKRRQWCLVNSGYILIVW